MSKISGNMKVIKKIENTEFAVFGEIDENGNIHCEDKTGTVIFATGLFSGPDSVACLGAETGSDKYTIVMHKRQNEIAKDYYRKIKRWDLVKELEQVERRVKAGKKHGT